MEETAQGAAEHNPYPRLAEFNHTALCAASLSRTR